MVETTNFGTPSGSASATSRARSVPIVPPSAMTPSMRPSSWSRFVKVDAPAAITVIALFSSPRATISGMVEPPAAATACLSNSAW